MISDRYRAECGTLRILLNATPLTGILTGIARYTRTLYDAILDLKLANVDFFVNGRASSKMPEQSNASVNEHFPAWIRDAAREIRLALLERRLNAMYSANSVDIYHETGMFPTSRSLTIPTVLTIYDLSLLKHGSYHPKDRVAHFRRHFFRRLNKVDRVITLSYFVRDEIVGKLDFPPNKVTAIPLAPAKIFSRRSDSMVCRYLSDNKIAQPFLLSVATNEPRKNLVGLIQALECTRSDNLLVLVGGSGWLNQDVVTQIKREDIRRRIVRLGHVSDEELALLYSGALALVYPSFYEGFGLPILEAMACGCPVICSDRGAMAEVAGDAAYLVNPRDIPALAEALEAVLADDSLRQSLVARGYKRCAEFSWEQTAQKTVATFQQVCRHRGTEFTG